MTEQEESTRIAQQEDHYEQRPDIPAIDKSELELFDQLGSFENSLVSWRPDREISAVLSQVPNGIDTSISGAPMRVMHDICRDVLRMVMGEVAEIVEKSIEERDHGSEIETVADDAAPGAAAGAAKPIELGVRILEDAVRIRISGELAIHCVKEGRKGASEPTKLRFAPDTLRALMQAHPAARAAKSDWTAEATVFMSAAVEYICAEVLELSAAKRKDDKKTEPANQLTSRHIFVAIRNDEELDKLFHNAIIPESGVLHWIHPYVMPRATKMEDVDEAKEKGEEEDGEEEEEDGKKKGKKEKKEEEEKEAEEDPDDDAFGESDADVLAEMESVMSHGAPLMERDGFAEFVKGVSAHVPQMEGCELAPDAIAALHAASEEYLTNMFQGACLAGFHAKRVKLFPKDIRLAQKNIWHLEQPEPPEVEEGEKEASLCIPRPAFKRLVEEVIQDAKEGAKRRKTREEPAQPAPTAAAAAAPPATGSDEGEEEEEEDSIITPEALDALHEAAEDALTQMMHGANRAAVHTGRETIMPKDIQLYRRLTHQRL